MQFYCVFCEPFMGSSRFVVQSCMYVKKMSCFSVHFCSLPWFSENRLWQCHVFVVPADELSDPNSTPLPSHRGTQHIGRRCCPTSPLPQCSLVVLTLNVRLAKPTRHKQPAQHNVFGQEVHVRPPIAPSTVLGANSSVELFPVSHSKKGDHKPT